MMATYPLLEAETAPFACGRSVLVPAVKLNILNGVAEAQLVNASASSSVTIDLDYRKRVDQFLSIGLMALH